MCTDPNGACGRLRAVCASHEHGAKSEVGRALLQQDHGVPGDVHAGPGPRQVSLLAWEWVLEFSRQQGVPVQPGNFAENLTLEGIDLDGIPVGAELRVGQALLEVTGRGKPEWSPGDYNFHGTALLAQRGLFARVVESGHVEPGSTVQLAAPKK